MRKLATPVTISSVEPVPGADRLEVAQMQGKGWRVVVGKGDFRPGDRAIMFEIDSALPVSDPRYAFLRERCLRRFTSKSGQVLKEVLRIRTVRLRGVLSQGLLMPLSLFPEAAGQPDGADLTEALGVAHYDEIAESLRPATGGRALSFDAYGPFPSEYIPKTDEERIQNLADYFQTMKGQLFEISEKADGSSLTMAFAPTIDAENPFMVCSRNFRLKPVNAQGEVPLPWRMAEKYRVMFALSEVMRTMGREYALQGELVGPGVNGNRDLLTDWEWRVFRIWDIGARRFMSPPAARLLCRRLAIPYVKVVAEAEDVFAAHPTMDDLLAYAEGKTDRGNEREGLVFKSIYEPYVSFKAVSNRYLLKQKD